MRAGIIILMAIVAGSGWALAADELPAWDKLAPGNSFAEFVTQNKASIVNLSNIDSLDRAEIRGLEVSNAPLTDWSTLGLKLTNVVCLRVTSSATDLPVAFFSAIMNFSRLEYLHLQCRQTLTIPSHVNLLTNLLHLRYLGIDAPAATYFDRGVYRIETLGELFVVAGAVSLPDGIARLSGLENLVIYGRRAKPIKGLPADLPKSMLRRLEFGNVLGIGDFLPSLPPNLAEFRALRCQLQTIPEPWLKGRKLEVVDLSNNRLARFPIGLLDIPSLKLIGLDLNSITNVPPLNVAGDRQLKVSLIGNPIQHFAPENNPLVERGVIEK